MNRKKRLIGGKKPLAFAGIFALVAIIEYLLLYEFAPDFLVQGFIDMTAKTLHFILSVTGAAVELAGEVLVFPDKTRLTIVYECTGGFAMFIFSACVIAYPSSLFSKVLGHLLGLIGIFIINMGRLLVLSWAVLHAPAAFDFIHKYLWQAVFILLVLALWAFWINLFTGKSPKKKKR